MTYQFLWKIPVTGKSMPDVVTQLHEAVEVSVLWEVIDEGSKTVDGRKQTQDSLHLKVTLASSRAHGQFSQNIQLLHPCLMSTEMRRLLKSVLILIDITNI